MQKAISKKKLLEYFQDQMKWSENSTGKETDEYYFLEGTIEKIKEGDFDEE